MKILQIHNYYQIAGGEDAVLENESLLLQKNSNDVQQFVVHNTAITSILDKVKTLLFAPFSFTYFNKLLVLLKQKQPEVVHVHNYFPLLSPSIFYACKKFNIPVVHTLHNYRAVCPTALLMFNKKVEERSITHSSWWAVKKRVYRHSMVGTFSLTTMIELHKRLGTWNSRVDRFIALTEFSRQKFIEAGWPEDKVVVKPNFIEDPYNKAETIEKEGGYALFVGRLSEEKGVDVLLEAWQEIDLPLKIIGEGPLKKMVQDNTTKRIEYLGRKDKKEVLNLVKNADFIIMPSTWYEGFPMVLVEAFACGTSAIVSRLGSMEEIVEDSKTGLHFEAGNSKDLIEKVNWMLKHPRKIVEMGTNARREYLTKYTPERNYEMLIDVYRQAITQNVRF